MILDSSVGSTKAEGGPIARRGEFREQNRSRHGLVASAPYRIDHAFHQRRIGQLSGRMQSSQMRQATAALEHALGKHPSIGLARSQRTTARD